MPSQWHGDIALDTETSVKGISITSRDEHGAIHIPTHATLRFLSIVETARIPLFLSLGQPYKVCTSQSQTESWLASILLGTSEPDAEHGRPWWQSAQANSSFGILLSVETSPSSTNNPPGIRTTELLLYASNHSSPTCLCPPTPPQSSPPHGECSQHSCGLEVSALPLSSDLLRHTGLDDSSPSCSPQKGALDGESPTFLPSASLPLPEAGEIVNLPPVRKRKTVDDTFHEAAERRQKARRTGGESIAAAAASRTTSNDALLSLKHRRSVSNTQAVPIQSRPLSRASSVSSVRQAPNREPSLSALAKRSSLACVQSVPAAQEASIEQKNKELVSRVVMAGMRLFGLVQSKARKPRAGSAAPSPAIDLGFDEVEVERKRDAEYKLVYHQVYKGTWFAFRQHILDKPLQPYTEALRETVDRLLNIFCCDPMVMGSGPTDDGFTPGGRQAFGSSAPATVEKKNPFLPSPK